MPVIETTPVSFSTGSAELRVSKVDNEATIVLNGELILSVASTGEQNLPNDEVRDITDKLQVGKNTLVVSLVNYHDNNPGTNPAELHANLKLGTTDHELHARVDAPLGQGLAHQRWVIITRS